MVRLHSSLARRPEPESRATMALSRSAKFPLMDFIRRMTCLSVYALLSLALSKGSSSTMTLTLRRMVDGLRSI
jgi:hypothetical protein